jgi:hypothetical protein
LATSSDVLEVQQLLAPIAGYSQAACRSPSIPPIVAKGEPVLQGLQSTASLHNNLQQSDRACRHVDEQAPLN